jgi:hypothetical protein
MRPCRATSRSRSVDVATAQETQTVFQVNSVSLIGFRANQLRQFLQNASGAACVFLGGCRSQMHRHLERKAEPPTSVVGGEEAERFLHSSFVEPREEAESFPVLYFRSITAPCFVPWLVNFKFLPDHCEPLPILAMWPGGPAPRFRKHPAGETHSVFWRSLRRSPTIAQAMRSRSMRQELNVI